MKGDLHARCAIAEDLIRRVVCLRGRDHRQSQRRRRSLGITSIPMRRNYGPRIRHKRAWSEIADATPAQFWRWRTAWPYRPDRLWVKVKSIIAMSRRVAASGYRRRAPRPLASRFRNDRRPDPWRGSSPSVPPGPGQAVFAVAGAQTRLIRAWAHLSNRTASIRHAAHFSVEGSCLWHRPGPDAAPQ